MFYALRYNEETFKWEVLCTTTTTDQAQYIINSIDDDLAMVTEDSLKRLIA